MAIVKDNMLLQLVRGTLGKQVTIYERNGQVIMAVKRSPTRKKPTEKQLAARDKMRAASLRARTVLADPELKAYYASLAGPGQNAYNLAVRDAYHDPEIQNISLTEKELVVTAKNKFRLAEVSVNTIDAKGNCIETGRAILARNGVDWHYKVSVLPPGGKLKVVVRGLLVHHYKTKELQLT